jgi:hypothetical protein
VLTRKYLSQPDPHVSVEEIAKTPGLIELYQYFPND